MANKAIDKAYLQQQFINYNTYVASQRYVTRWEEIPDPGWTGANKETAYTEAQYTMYNEKIVQWAGNDNSWSDGDNSVDLVKGRFYEITMAEVTDNGTSYDPKQYEITAITPIGSQDLTEGTGIAIDESDPANPVISAEVYTATTYNKDILRTLDYGNISCQHTSIVFQNRSRVDSVSVMEDMATSATSEDLGYVVQYTGDTELPAEESEGDGGASPVAEGVDPTPQLLKQGHFYQLKYDEINDGYYWEETTIFSINTSYDSNNALTYDSNGLVDLSRLDSAGLTLCLNTPPAQVASGLVFQYVGADQDFTVYDAEGLDVTESKHLYQGRFYKMFQTGYGIAITDIGSQQDVEYSILSTDSDSAGFWYNGVFYVANSTYTNTEAATPYYGWKPEGSNTVYYTATAQPNSNFSIYSDNTLETEVATIPIGDFKAANNSILKTYQLMKSVDGGAPQAVTGSVINIPKDFLVKSATVRTYSTEGGIWFKGKFYEKDANYTATAGEIKLTNGSKTVYLANDLDSIPTIDWPEPVYSNAACTTTAGSILASDVVLPWTDASTPANPVTGEKYIDFVINTKDTQAGSGTSEHLYVALHDLVESYTAGTGILISNDNVIGLDLEDDPITFDISDFS